jgi:hypothetical protein
MMFVSAYFSRRLRCLPVLLSAFSGPAWAQSAPPPAEPSDPSQLRVSGGLRLWSAKWDSWNVNPVATGVYLGDSRYEVVEASGCREKLALVPFVSLRYGAVFVSASAMTNTSYQLHETGTPGGFDVGSSRSEFDFNLGYVFSPGVSLSLGNKRITQRFGPDGYQWSGPVLGLSAGAPLSSGWGLYTSLGLGRLRGKFSRSDAAGHTRFGTDYRLMEAGFTYNVPTSVTWMRSLVLTTGYRIQRMATKGYSLAVTPSVGSPGENSSADLVDTTQGLVLGLQGTF